MIASFLFMPHATMPNLPLSHQDAKHIAAIILEKKNWRYRDRTRSNQGPCTKLMVLAGFNSNSIQRRA
jgi:hypothetical protein